MPYPAGHPIDVKGKIIQSARRLFNRHGFDNVSLKQIMAGAGLTHGGFSSDHGSVPVLPLPRISKPDAVLS